MSEKPSNIWRNISSMRRSVSSPDETLRRELKIRRETEYFWWTSRCFIWWWNTVSNAWYYFSNNMILVGEIKDAKMSSFSSDFQQLNKHQFPLYFSLWNINEFEKWTSKLLWLDKQKRWKTTLPSWSVKADVKACGLVPMLLNASTVKSYLWNFLRPKKFPVRMAVVFLANTEALYGSVRVMW